jgi:hypothetical protein
MHLKPFFSDGRPLRAFLSVIAERIDGYAAARQKLSPNFHVFWVHQRNEVFHNNVDAILVEIAVISEAEQIELK